MHYNLNFDFFPSQFYAHADIEREHSSRFVIPQSTLSSAPQTKSVTYNDLVDQTILIMHPPQGTREAVEETYSHRNSLHGKLTLKAYEWTLRIKQKSLGQLRMVHIRGAKNEIINTWVFPNRPTHMPVFAAELIGVGNSTKVAFVDIQTPAASESLSEDVAAITAGLALRFSSLPCNETPPDWATQDSQGNFTYARDVPYEQLHCVHECYLSYLQTYLEAFASGSEAMEIGNSERDERAIDLLQVYQHHHMEHSPGNKFLSKLYGSDWTESFMNNFLFAKPRG